jgi:Holliday junction resolvase
MSGTKSREKGKRGERQGAKALSEILGAELRRGVQYHGGPNSPDIVGVDGLHVECKYDEVTIGKKLYSALSQADNDCSENIPFVLSRRNREGWVVAIRLENLVEFSRQVVKIVDS